MHINYIFLNRKRILYLDIQIIIYLFFADILLEFANSDLFTKNFYRRTTCFHFYCGLINLKEKKIFRFFKPDRNFQKDDEKSFLKKILHKTRNYFGLGLGFGILRMLVSDVTVLAPKNCHKIFNMSTLKPGLFTGSYVAVYEVTFTHGSSQYRGRTFFFFFFWKERGAFRRPKKFQQICTVFEHYLYSFIQIAYNTMYDMQNA